MDARWPLRTQSGAAESMYCSCHSFLSRRGFLTGATALAATAARAQTAPRRVDVHHHITAPTWLDAVKKAKLDNPPMSNWTPQRSIEDMDKAGTATAITSPTTPQIGFLSAPDAARIARESNEYAKRLMTDFPDESLGEIEYAFDTLRVDGIGMMTSYGDKWLGDPQFAPVFDELNRRKATVYTHPTTANCCINLVQGIGDATVEYGADTTRTIANLIFSGAAQRYGEINFIFSHGGGVLTAVAERLQIQMVTTPPYKGRFTRDIVDSQLRRFYYDTAQVANAVTIDALAKLVPTSQIVFGTDYPYRTGAEQAQALAQRFGAGDLKAIDRDNALRILPRLRAA